MSYIMLFGVASLLLLLLVVTLLEASPSTPPEPRDPGIEDLVGRFEDAMVAAEITAERSWVVKLDFEFDWIPGSVPSLL